MDFANGALTLMCWRLDLLWSLIFIGTVALRIHVHILNNNIYTGVTSIVQWIQVYYRPQNEASWRMNLGLLAVPWMTICTQWAHRRRRCSGLDSRAHTFRNCLNWAPCFLSCSLPGLQIWAEYICHVSVFRRCHISGPRALQILPRTDIIQRHSIVLGSGSLDYRCIVGYKCIFIIHMLLRWPKGKLGYK